MRTRREWWHSDLDVQENVRRRLPKLTRKYFRRGRNALDTERSWEEIHEFRLATKRFRYTLEVFRSIYGPGIEQRLDDLKHIQKLLGDANDCMITRTMLAEIPGTESLRGKLEVRAVSRIRNLRSWWREHMAPAAVEQRWIRYFQRFAGKPVASVSSMAELTETFKNAIR
jgi:CHAD domain-containing protein